MFLLFCLFPLHSHASENRIAEAGRKLVAAYPDYLDEVRGNNLVWKDGTEMPLDDGKPEKEFQELIVAPHLEDMFAMPYPRGLPSAPPINQDPGRVRFQPFFEKMYGNCREKTNKRNIVSVRWLKNKGGGTLQLSRLNDVAKKVLAVSEELDQLPSSYDHYLLPTEGGYYCRTIKGTKRLSPHSYGIAIDIGVDKSHYWRWQTSSGSSSNVWHSHVPYEIIKIFEKHGFIW
ncbi:MAG: M15 family metallopeptidase, partial [Hyphomicrobium sp.]